MIRSGTPVDDFLADAGTSTSGGERLEQIGLVGSLTGIVAATGLFVFLALVHRGTASEIRVVLRWIGVAGAAALVGAVIEVVGIGSVLDVGWSDALTGERGSAAMMRILAGLLVLLGTLEHVVPAVAPDADVLVDPVGRGEVRWVPSTSAAIALVGAAIGVASFGFDGHTVTEGPRVVHATVDAVHVVAGSVWFGGIAGIAVVGWLRRRSDTGAAPLLAAFAPVGTVALAAVAVAGGVMTLFVVDAMSDLTGTDWGRILLVKLAAVAVAAGIGAYHHFVTVPAIEAGDTRRGRTTIRVELAVLLGVVVATAFLVRASTI